MVSVIIAAGGQGQRMASGMPKQFIPLAGKPVIWHSVHTLHQMHTVDEIIIVTLPEYITYCQQTFRHCNKISHIISGGESRQQSVYLGLQKVNPLSDAVLVHDAARPFIRREIIQHIIDAILLEGNAAISAVKVKDTIKSATGSNLVEATLDRDKLWAVQTPQGIPYADFLKAHEKALENHYIATDDAALAEYIGCKVKLIAGHYDNIKLTTPEDFYLAEGIIKNWVCHKN